MERRTLTESLSLRDARRSEGERRGGSSGVGRRKKALSRMESRGCGRAECADVRGSAVVFVFVFVAEVVVEGWRVYVYEDGIWRRGSPDLYSGTWTQMQRKAGGE